MNIFKSISFMTIIKKGKKHTVKNDLMNNNYKNKFLILQFYYAILLLILRGKNQIRN